MSGEKQHSDGRPAGQLLGQSDEDKVGFYGASPVVQPSVTALATAVFSVAKTGIYGFASSTAAAALITTVQSLQTALDSLGLVDKA